MDYRGYQMFMDYLNLSSNIIKSDLYHFPEYGTYICGSQVKLDISKMNYLRIINAFTQIESDKAYLFANSEFSCAYWYTSISTYIFLQESMHGIYPENVCVNAILLNDEADFFDYLNHSSIFTAERDCQTY